MSNLSDLFNIGEKDGGAIVTTGEIFGTLADFSGAIGFAQLAVETIEGLFSQDSELQDLLNSLLASVAALHAQISASDKLQRMRDIDEGINGAVGVFGQLPAILSSNPPVSQDYKEGQIQTCVDAVLFFTDYDDKWQAVWADMPYYSDSWSHALAPEASSDGLVFDYIYTLPQFLRAIYIFLTTIGALAPSSLSEYRDVLTRCLSRLESVHQTITNGIAGTRIPVYYEIGSILVPGEGSGEEPGWDSTWNDNGFIFPYGAVEIYSGMSIVRSYWDAFFPYEWAADEGSRDTSDRFLRLLKLRIASQEKALYSRIGMPIVRSVINQLRNFTGQPLLTDEPYERWSADEVSAILHLPSGASPTTLPLIEGSLKTFLQQTPPYVGFDVFGDDPDTVPPYHMWVPPKPLPSGSLYYFLTEGILMGQWLEPVMYIMMS